MISLIAAVDQNNGLGFQGKLLFRIKEDMLFFRNITKNHKIIMGHNTWDSLPSKLPKRENIVVSRHKFPGPDRIIHNTQSLINTYQNSNEEVFIIGGGILYTEFLPYASTIYLTEIKASVPDVDTFFPSFDKSQYSKKIIKKGKENGLNYSIVKYSKKQ